MNSGMRLAFAWLVLLLPLWGQIVPGRYIVELDREPAVLEKGRRGAAGPDRARLRQVLAERDVAVLGSVETVANALVVEASSESELAALPGVRRIHPVRLYKLLLDRAVLLQSVTQAWAQVGVENAGRGIKIGIIDTGIDATHPGLQDSDLRVPDGFPKVTNPDDIGSTNNKIIVARTYDGRSSASARDTKGHGTGVAMIAAGRTATGRYGIITGIAPKAWLGNYKVFADASEGAPTDAVLRALDDAVADGMDVVNLSLGSFPAEMPGDDVLARAVERASAAGVIVTVAAGNSGPDAATIGSPATAASAIAVGNAWTDRIFASTVRVQGAPAIVAVPGRGSEGNARVSGALTDVSLFDSSGLACSALPEGSLRGQIALILRGDCFFEDKLRNAQQAGAVAALVYTHAQSPEASTMNTGTAQLPALMVSNRDGLALKERLQSGGTVNVDLMFEPTPVTVDSARLSVSSSKGPSADAAIKPDMLAVGVSISTADTRDRGAGFQVSGGTSFSAPMVAGAAAILKAARPGLTVGQYRSLLINAADTFTYDRVGPAPVQDTGAGLLNVLSSLRSTLATAPQTVNLGSGSPDLNQAVTLTLSNLSTAEDTYAISITPVGNALLPLLPQTSATVAGGQSARVTLRFEAAGLRAGAHAAFVVIRSSTSDSVARIPYWYGVPSPEVAAVTVADPPLEGRTSSLQNFAIRPSDLSGFAVDVPVTVTVVEGGGSVRSVQRSTWYPGFWEARVRLGPTAGANVFEVSAGGRTTRVSIAGE